VVAGSACLAVFVGILSLSAPSSEPKEEFEKATRFFKAGEYEAALPHFQRAYELSNRRPSTVLGLAQCERALKRYESAVVHFREYLASKPTPADAASVAETLKLVEDLRAEVGDQKPNPYSGSPPEETPPVDGSAPPGEKPRQATAQQTSAEQAPSEAPRLVAPPPESSEPSVIESPLFWILTGAAVVAGGVALTIALASGKEKPYSGSSGVFISGP
jgi:tetratricopeptide (TPR) repeat protein